MKKHWDSLLQISTTLAALLAFTMCGIFFILVGSIIVVIIKIWVFIK